MKLSLQRQLDPGPAHLDLDHLETQRIQFTQCRRTLCVCSSESLLHHMQHLHPPTLRNPGRSQPHLPLLIPRMTLWMTNPGLLIFPKVTPERKERSQVSHLLGPSLTFSEDDIATSTGSKKKPAEDSTSALPAFGLPLRRWGNRSLAGSDQWERYARSKPYDIRVPGLDNCGVPECSSCSRFRSRGQETKKKAQSEPQMYRLDLAVTVIIDELDPVEEFAENSRVIREAIGGDVTLEEDRVFKPAVGRDTGGGQSVKPAVGQHSLQEVFSEDLFGTYKDTEQQMDSDSETPDLLMDLETNTYLQKTDATGSRTVQTLQTLQTLQTVRTVQTSAAAGVSKAPPPAASASTPLPSSSSDVSAAGASKAPPPAASASTPLPSSSSDVSAAGASKAPPPAASASTPLPSSSSDVSAAGASKAPPPAASASTPLPSSSSDVSAAGASKAPPPAASASTPLPPPALMSLLLVLQSSTSCCVCVHLCPPPALMSLLLVPPKLRLLLRLRPHLCPPPALCSSHKLRSVLSCPHTVLYMSLNSKTHLRKVDSSLNTHPHTAASARAGRDSLLVGTGGGAVGQEEVSTRTPLYCDSPGPRHLCPSAYWLIERAVVEERERERKKERERQMCAHEATSQSQTRPRSPQRDPDQSQSCCSSGSYFVQIKVSVWSFYEAVPPLPHVQFLQALCSLQHLSPPPGLHRDALVLSSALNFGPVVEESVLQLLNCICSVFRGPSSPEPRIISKTPQVQSQSCRTPPESCIISKTPQVQSQSCRPPPEPCIISKTSQVQSQSCRPPPESCIISKTPQVQSQSCRPPPESCIISKTPQVQSQGCRPPPEPCIISRRRRTSQFCGSPCRNNGAYEWDFKRYVPRCLVILRELNLVGFQTGVLFIPDTRLCSGAAFVCLLELCILTAPLSVCVCNRAFSLSRHEALLRACEVAASALELHRLNCSVGDSFMQSLEETMKQMIHSLMSSEEQRVQSVQQETPEQVRTNTQLL
ncbi:hypothetical protein WMY93_033782 [Mugilogobius chulae]|uniref:Uncharacterized protein n=1 Tax=Mugilogobius chulae TaxID=88201 RepID=A0AAW0MSQ0_9GOBI